MSKNNRVVIKATELILLLVGLISTLLMLKEVLRIPYSCEFVFSSVIGFWNTTRCIFSSPLYICIVINFMVVLIAVLSTFHNHDDDAKVFSQDLQNTIKPLDSFPPPLTPEPSITLAHVETMASKPSLELGSMEFVSGDLLEVLVSDETIRKLRIDTNHLEKSNDFKKTVHTTLNRSSNISQSTEIKNQPYSHEKQGDATYNQKDEFEEIDTIDATWRLITGEGPKRPKKKELKKSETFTLLQDSSHVTQHLKSEVILPSIAKGEKELRKLETFNDVMSIRRNGGMRRDPSMSLNEFNNQVEAFIKNFNNDMRLQRQESDQRFVEMINPRL